MFVFRHGARTVLPSLAYGAPRAAVQRAYASRIAIPYTPPPVPVIEACPSPTCQCRDMPAGLDIEREQNISGSMAAYAEQVLISTGQNDWKSKIEDEDDGVLVRQLKAFLGPKGRYSDPFHNVMISNSSFPPTPSLPDQPEPTASAFLLPSFQYVPHIPTDQAGVDAFIKGFVKPSQLHQSHDRLTREEKNILLRQPELQKQFIGARGIHEILVLICGHGGRDSRCGILGPLLKQEFEDKLQQQNVPIIESTPVSQARQIRTDVEGYSPTARVGLISHIGGHKWAGNVIVYIPPAFRGNALAGKGIWYGRVEPGHVEGIVAKTVLDGKVIKELFRGGVGQGGEIIRL